VVEITGRRPFALTGLWPSGGNQHQSWVSPRPRCKCRARRC